MHVYEYFLQKEREAAECSLAPEWDFWTMVATEVGSRGKRGQVLGNFILTESAFLSVHERVVVKNSHVTRESYAYFLIIDGVAVWGEERDPTHSPAVHRHTDEDDRMQPSEPISFKAAAEQVWNEVVRRGAF